jgi:hypothetical protein
MFFWASGAVLSHKSHACQTGRHPGARTPKMQAGEKNKTKFVIFALYFLFFYSLSDGQGFCQNFIMLAPQSFQIKHFASQVAR